jgi:predicted nucleic acid-binding protein
LIAYVDTSALVKLAVDEVGSTQMRSLWDEGVPAAGSAIGYAELCCALAAVVRSGRLPASAADEVFTLAHEIWKRVFAVSADMELTRHAGALGAYHGLGALDAIHLATVLSLSQAEPTVVSWDEKLRQAAAAEGLPVYPETTTAALR